MLILQLPNNDINLYDYVHIKNEMPEGGLTDKEIIDMVLNANKEEKNINEIELFTPEKVSLAEAKKSIDETIRFLYEQGPEFGEVDEELKVLRRLHKQVKLLIIKNLKQVDLHYL
jgi:hypothetical protein